MGTRPPPALRRLLLAAISALAASLPAAAGDLTSASFTSRAGHVSAGGTAALAAASHSGAGSAGQSEAIGFTGATPGLATQAGGFWPLVVGVFASLDLDADGQQAFLDLDDDGDGLADVVETDTGVFVSESDTGTDPNNADSDGDGFGDGAEVVAHTDPNDAGSPGPAPIPSIPLLGVLTTFLALLATAARGLRGEAR